MSTEEVKVLSRKEKVQKVKEKFSGFDWTIIPENKLDELHSFLYRIYLV